MKKTTKFFAKVLRSLPDVSFRPKRSETLPTVLGAIGIAILGGIAAVLIFSPRTRYRALGAAKDAYGKVSDQIAHSGLGEQLGMAPPNGVPERAGAGFRSGV